MAKLSIITINLNNYHGLCKTIESVLKQTYTDVEYLIIDGGSTDGSVDIIKKHENKIAYWVSESDKGIYNAMNKGILKAKGEYCLFLNSGDWLYKNTGLHDVFNLSNEEDIIYCDKVTAKGVKEQPNILTLYQFIFGSLSHQATFIKRELFDLIGLYNEQNLIQSDWEFFLKLILHHKFTYRHIQIPITYQDLNGISHNEKYTSIIKKERSDILNREISPFMLADYERLRIYDKSRMVKWVVNIKNTKIYTWLIRFILKLRH